MTSLVIVDRENPISSPDEMRVSSVLAKLKEAGFDVSRMSISACSAASVLRLVEQNGEMILPVTLVNNFPMITGRYPSNDEMKQILSVPDGIIEPKHCGCCCIEGCGCE